ncbi:MAG: hypothetical protein ACRERU_00975 [Methylococcales bacterium]
MSFVLDNSVTMRWFFGDGSPQELIYAGDVLEAMKCNRNYEGPLSFVYPLCLVENSRISDSGPS